MKEIVKSAYKVDKSARKNVRKRAKNVMYERKLIVN